MKKVAVVGAGSMGHGIAEVAALSGYEVWINDVAESILQNALQRISWSVEKLVEKGSVKESADSIISRIHATTNQEEALRGAVLMIEAVIEDLETKRKVFSKAETLVESDAVLASNTSSLPITEIAKNLAKPERVVGMHFFNPPVLMPLVEVIRGERTSDEYFKKAIDFAKSFGKEIVPVNKDIPGFLVNRLLFRVSEVACLLHERDGIDVKEIDSAAIYQLGFPMGVFLLHDYAGVDVGYLVGKAMTERGFNVYTCESLKQLYTEGKYGYKSGEGYYKYPEKGKFVRPSIPQDIGRQLNAYILLTTAVNEAAFLIREGIVSEEDIDKGCKLGLNWPKGILQYADEYGIDNFVKELRNLRQKYDLPQFEPDPFLEKMVSEGKTGKKAGRGFYDYSGITELKTVRIVKEKPLAWVILNRPERLNAINAEMVRELSSTLDQLEEDGDVRVIVVRGEGRGFSAGADIMEFLNLSPIKAVIASRRLQELYNKIRFLTKPVIAVIHGFAYGGGLELALACDMRISEADAKLGQPEVNLGLIPGAGGTQRLPRLSRKGIEMIFTGGEIMGKEAFSYGIVDRVVEKGKAEEEAKALAMKIAEKSPLSIMAAKLSINYGEQTNVWNGLMQEATFFGLLFSTKDIQEGVTAFLERRKPNFRGE
ncbi:3-hydroxyacyl-CoA dehydrogenase [Sulfolobales archaeon HS-7]|nr:3-hydroxyacyl-CoA dehydrogenase [Sulfolobales archaeon HS-7]